MIAERTQVAIVGAGPAGLLLGQLLQRQGVDAVILEARDREYVEARIRAGLLEQGTTETLREAGVGERLDREGLVHGGIYLNFGRRRHRQGQARELRCDLIAGCDGYHGVCRPGVPAEVLRIWEREYPFVWLGILAEVAPSTDELIYAQHERGFALHSMRSPEISRLYIQVNPDQDLADWPDVRIWAELHERLHCDGWSLTEGPIADKSIAPMRSFVAEPMRYRSLLLAGDAAHIVPATGAKGLNLAVADVSVLADAIIARLRGSGSETGLDEYSDRCLDRVWRAQHFSWWLTTMLHNDPGGDAYSRRLQRAQLEYVVSSPAAATTLAENYVGLPLPSSDRATAAGG